MKTIPAYFSSALASGKLPLLALLIPAVLASCEKPVKEVPRYDYLPMAATLEKSLFNDIMDHWYPLILDSAAGGYLSGFTHTWEMTDAQTKSIVYEARHVWTTSYVYKNYPERAEYLEYADHGFQFMKDHLWDSQHGGYFIDVSRQGEPLPSTMDEKRIYGNAFAIYALAQYYEVSQKEEVLEWAKKSFQWIEEHAHDPVNGGYFEFLMRDGTPILEDDAIAVQQRDRLTKGYKDFNSSIHILEALTTLYLVWPDELVKERLEEMFLIIRDVMVAEPGYLKLYFHPDWTPVLSEELDEKAGENLWFTDHVTFGHDIETAFLLYEAAEALDSYDEKTQKICKKLVDHTIIKGWDNEYGGFFEKGKYIDGDSLTIIDHHKSWWTEVEGFNSLLLMHALYPEDDMDYYGYFLDQWEYLHTYMIDHEYGGWYNSGLDTNPKSRTAAKAHNWKTTYHNGRGMINCVNRLRALASGNTAEAH